MLIFGEEWSKLCGLRLGSRDGAHLLLSARAGIMGKLTQTLTENSRTTSGHAVMTS